MTEYWKSNPRKFCDFCKCWIAENRPSIEFHEKGKRHKESVAKRLQEMCKKGKEDYDTQLRKDDYIKQMEAAALKAYKKDIESNPDLMGVQISEIASSSNAEIVVKKTSPEKKPAKKKKMRTSKPLKWREAKSDDGNVYYWNADTKESVWEAPLEGFISLEKQNNQMKKCVNNSTESFGPAPRAMAYSSWHTVVKAAPVDLQLPELPEEDYTPPVVVYSKPKIEFKEKTIKLEADSSSSTVSFKKRSQNCDKKRNVRSRTDNM